MSPEVYAGIRYSYEVDMWAFGVVFYFMLNLDYPFRKTSFNLDLNPHMPEDVKAKELLNQATNFSYRSKVKNTKKKLE